MLHPEFSSSPELPHRAVMPRSNLPISEAQKIDDSAHHDHAHKSQKTLFGANSPQTCCSARCRSRSHKASPSQAMSCLSNVLDYYPNEVCLWPHTIVLLLLCHLPTTPIFFTILAAVMLDRRIVKASFSKGTFSNRCLWTGITLKPYGISSKNFQGINFGLCGTLQGRF